MWRRCDHPRQKMSRVALLELRSASWPYGEECARNRRAFRAFLPPAKPIKWHRASPQINSSCEPLQVSLSSRRFTLIFSAKSKVSAKIDSAVFSLSNSPVPGGGGQCRAVDGRRGLGGERRTLKTSKERWGCERFHQVGESRRRSRH